MVSSNKNSNQATPAFEIEQRYMDERIPPSNTRKRQRYSRCINPKDPPKEEATPTIHRGIRDRKIWMWPAQQDKSDDISSPQTNARKSKSLQTMDLMRDEDPLFAYQKVKGKNPISLGHADGWGVVEMAIAYQRRERDQSSGEINFEEPASTKVQYVAIKTLRKQVVAKYLRAGGHENPYIEILRMQQLGDDIHVLKCVEALEDDDYIYIITPWCFEGSLTDNIRWASFETGNPGYTEDEARKIFTQILRTLCYLKRNGICHRDISPNNFMFYKGNLVLVDFAMSMRTPRDKFGRCDLIKPQKGQFGTIAYQAPEVFTSKYAFDGNGVDLWSVAVILYNLLTGHILYFMPCHTDLLFRYGLLAKGLSRNPKNSLTTEVMNDMFSKNRTGNKSEHRGVQDAILSRAQANRKISPDAMELLENLLAVDPSKRWSLEQAVESNWIQKTGAE